MLHGMLAYFNLLKHIRTQMKFVSVLVSSRMCICSYISVLAITLIQYCTYVHKKLAYTTSLYGHFEFNLMYIDL